MTANSFLRWTILVGIFLVPFIVFLVPSGWFFPFITGKNVAFRVLVEIITPLWVILAVRSPRFRPKSSWLIWTFGALVVSLIISNLLSPNTLKSFWSNYERMEGWVTIVHLFAYVLVLSSVLNSGDWWRRFWNTSIFASVIMGFYGLFQLAGKVTINQGGVRLDGTLGNSTYLAVYMLFHIFITSWLLLQATGKRWLQVTYGLIILFQTYILYHTATRGAVLGLLAGALLTSVLIAIFEKQQQRLRKMALGVVVLALIIVGGFLAVKNTDVVKESPVLSRFASISLTERTVQSRFLVWNMAWQGFIEKPIFGWGQESFNYVFNKYYDPKMHNQEQWFDRTHNVVLDWAIAGGLVGLVLYLGIFGFLLWYIWKTGDWSFTERSLFTGLLAAYFIHNLFVFDNLISYLLFFAFVAYIYSRSNHSQEPVQFVVSKPVVNWVVAPLAIIISVGAIYWINIKPIKANTALIEALRNGDNPQVQLENFDRAFNYNTFGNAEITEHLIYQNNALVRSDAPEELKLQYVQFTKDKIDNQLVKTPDDTRYLLFAGGFYNAIGAYGEAITHLTRALETSPNKQQIMFELVNAYSGQGDSAAVLRILKEAYELEPAYNEARIYYAIALWQAGDEELSNKLLSDLAPEVLAVSNRAINFYAETQQYQKLAMLWETRVQNNPVDSQARLSLAASYFELGERDKAIEQIQSVIELNPGFREQGEHYISEIRAGRRP